MKIRSLFLSVCLMVPSVVIAQTATPTPSPTPSPVAVTSCLSTEDQKTATYSRLSRTFSLAQGTVSGAVRTAARTSCGFKRNSGIRVLNSTSSVQRIVDQCTTAIADGATCRESRTRRYSVTGNATVCCLKATATPAPTGTATATSTATATTTSAS
jgi:hypothetical protein